MTSLFLSLLLGSHFGGGGGVMHRVVDGVAGKVITFKVTSGDDPDDSDTGADSDEDSDLEAIPPEPPTPPTAPTPPTPPTPPMPPIPPTMGIFGGVGTSAPRKITIKGKDTPTVEVLH